MGRSTLISLNTTQAHIQTPSRMNKLLMLAFLVALMGLMATAAPQDEVEELELEDMAEDEAMEDVVEPREEWSIQIKRMWTLIDRLLLPDQGHDLPQPDQDPGGQLPEAARQDCGCQQDRGEEEREERHFRLHSPADHQVWRW